MAYETRSPQGASVWRLKVLRVFSAPGKTEAECQRTTQRDHEPEVTAPARVLVDKNGVYVDGDIEYKFPVIAGVSWDESPRRYEITAVDARVATPAGTFDDCLEVTYTIAGGDAGFGRRLYAPNVGFVYESCSDETDPFEIQLASISE